MGDLKNWRAPLLCRIKLYSPLHRHMRIQTGAMVRKRPNGVLTPVPLTFDLWPWPFAQTSLLLLVIIPKNFMMIRWWEHSENVQKTDGLKHSYSCLVGAKNLLLWCNYCGSWFILASASQNATEMNETWYSEYRKSPSYHCTLPPR